ncbi:MAG: lamin tail domain-containing protein [Deltaproteobacteria bacterium]|nr:lamin tail domain-containing protein [Deltaproteobacteria bacterium]
MNSNPVHIIFLMTALAAAPLGCSEAADSDPSSSSMSSAVATGSSSSVASSASASSTSTGAGGTGGGTLGVVLNEVSGVGDDYLELYNAGDAPVDLSGFKVADDDGGIPKLAEASVFPTGTNLAPGAYLFVLADLKTAMAGPQTMCDPGPSPCFQATFGISKSGDVLYLLDGTDAVVESVPFPATVLDGQSWGRLPNGTGSFAANKPTPGAANAAP